jgi:hypothetical protein
VLRLIPWNGEPQHEGNPDASVRRWTSGPTSPARWFTSSSTTPHRKPTNDYPPGRIRERNGLRRRRARPGDEWHLDEVFIKIARTHYLWRLLTNTAMSWDILVTS